MVVSSEPGITEGSALFIDRHDIKQPDCAYSLSKHRPIGAFFKLLAKELSKLQVREVDMLGLRLLLADAVFNTFRLLL